MLAGAGPRCQRQTFLGQQRRGSARQGDTVTEQSAPARVGGVEVRSIDYVPLNERHGKLSDLGPLWFMSNAQIATLAVGLVSITSGGNLLWSLIAIVSGTLIGTFFMAFHSAQGPQLGLPQMIQSRPQFGYVGALLVWLFAYLQYAGFNIFNTVLAGQALNTTIHGGQTFWIVVVTVVAQVWRSSATTSSTVSSGTSPLGSSWSSASSPWARW